jgi:hypothetical protein
MVRFTWFGCSIMSVDLCVYQTFVHQQMFRKWFYPIRTRLEWKL